MRVSRKGLILNLVGLAFVMALSVSTTVAYYQMNAELSSSACSGGICEARLRPFYRTEAWIFILSLPALFLILTGTQTLYQAAKKASSMNREDSWT